MPREIELGDEARREIAEAFDWYAERSPGIAGSFLAELERALSLVAESPEVWPELDEEFRRYLLRRFPYSLIDSFSEDRVIVEALAHHHRRPGYWRSR